MGYPLLPSSDVFVEKKKVFMKIDVEIVK